jgi:hypothetical protein
VPVQVLIILRTNESYVEIEEMAVGTGGNLPILKEQNATLIKEII